MIDRILAKIRNFLTNSGFYIGEKCQYIKKRATILETLQIVDFLPN